MKISLLTGMCALGAVASVHAADLSPEMKAYTLSLFASHEKLMAEFEHYAGQFPIQSAYFVGLFSTTSCGNPPPSENLTSRAKVDEFVESTDGQKVFVVMGAVSTMSYPTPEQKAGFCESAKHLVDVAEAEAAKPQ